MRRRFAIFLLAALLLLLLTTTASAHGLDSAKLQNAGWSCVIAGPHEWVHCFPPGSPMVNGMATTVKVFDCHDPCIVERDAEGQPTGAFTGSGHPFFGTELLINQNVYAGQPCGTDGGEHYHYLGSDPPFLPFYACHHFDTGGHDH